MWQRIHNVPLTASGPDLADAYPLDALLLPPSLNGIEQLVFSGFHGTTVRIEHVSTVVACPECAATSVR